MIIKVQITIMSDEGTTEIVEEVARLEPVMNYEP